VDKGIACRERGVFADVRARNGSSGVGAGVVVVAWQLLNHRATETTLTNRSCASTLRGDEFSNSVR